MLILKLFLQSITLPKNRHTSLSNLAITSSYSILYWLTAVRQHWTSKVLTSWIWLFKNCPATWQICSITKTNQPPLKSVSKVGSPPVVGAEWLEITELSKRNMGIDGGNCPAVRQMEYKCKQYPLRTWMRSVLYFSGVSSPRSTCRASRTLPSSRYSRYFCCRSRNFIRWGEDKGEIWEKQNLNSVFNLTLIGRDFMHWSND